MKTCIPSFGIGVSNEGFVKKDRENTSVKRIGYDKFSFVKCINPFFYWGGTILSLALLSGNVLLG